MKDKGACVHHLHQGAAQAQEELGMGFHGAAHIHQHHHFGQAAFAPHMVQLHQLTAGAECLAQGAAQVDGAALGVVLQAAHQLGAQAALEGLHEGLEAVHVTG